MTSYGDDVDADNPMRPAVGCLRGVILGTLLWILLAMLLWFAVSSVSAYEIEGNQTVAAWRQTIRADANWPTLYAAGAVAAMNLTWMCASPLTVGEWAAYLRFGADPELTLRQAMLLQLYRHGCEFNSEALRDSMRRP